MLYFVAVVVLMLVQNSLEKPTRNPIVLNEDFWRFLEIFGDFWRFLAIFGNFWPHCGLTWPAFASGLTTSGLSLDDDDDSLVTSLHK